MNFKFKGFTIFCSTLMYRLRSSSPLLQDTLGISALQSEQEEWRIVCFAASLLQCVFAVFIPALRPLLWLYRHKATKYNLPVVQAVNCCMCIVC